jgi:putative Mn2+ efflux pump MntP
MTVQGAMFPKIRQKELLKTGLFVGSWQALGFLLGNRLMPISVLIGLNNIQSLSRVSLRILSFVIFSGLGLLMMQRGTKREYINEQRQEVIEFKQLVTITLFSSINSFLAGLGLSFTGTQLGTEFIIVYLISILSVIIGVYIGYWFGYEQKPKAYTMSGIIFLVSATSVLL